MTQKNRILILAGLTVAALIIGVAFSVSFLGNTDTDIMLRMIGNECAVGKETLIAVKKNKKITWHVRNECTGQRTVSVGNFRQNQQTDDKTCSKSMTGITWPFKAEDENKRAVSPGQGQERNIALHDAKNDTNSPIEYYFSVCLENAAVDPRLVIDP
jgi:hypothetical protein